MTKMPRALTNACNNANFMTCNLCKYSSIIWVYNLGELAFLNGWIKEYSSAAFYIYDCKLKFMDIRKFLRAIIDGKPCSSILLCDLHHVTSGSTADIKDIILETDKLIPQAIEAYKTRKLINEINALTDSKKTENNKEQHYIVL